VARTVVAHPADVQPIAKTRVKTEKLAVTHLARMLVANMIPQVWVPPDEVRELRSLLAHRQRLIKMSTMTKNWLRSVIHRHNLTSPKGSLFSPKNRAWWDQQPVSATERLRVSQDLATLDHLTAQIEGVDQELARLSTTEPWASQVVFLMQISGFGLILSMIVLAAFPTAKKLVGYSGLGASVHGSGKEHREGHITKRGRKELRWALVEAAWAAVRTDPYWKAQFERLTRRKHPNVAIVAIACRLLVTAWHLLTKREAYHLASPEQITHKLLNWSYKLDDHRRQGLTRPQFIRYCLLRLGIDYDVRRIIYGGYPRRIAGADEGLALRPELQPSDA